jgi:hypothetical protein
VACLDAGVPVVVTLCDFWFLCPRHTLLQPDGSVCPGPEPPRKCVPCVRDLHGFAPLPAGPVGPIPSSNITCLRRGFVVIVTSIDTCS